jgi:hypothetical protein
VEGRGYNLPETCRAKYRGIKNTYSVHLVGLSIEHKLDSVIVLKNPLKEKKILENNLDVLLGHSVLTTSYISF